ncbi:MAG: hypothetical protein WKH47_05820 [Actinomycetes bacterium]
MSNHRDDDLEPALRAMLGDHHLDVHPRADAVGTVLDGVGRARRRRNAGYAAASTLVVAGVIGAITLTGGDVPQGFDPVVTPSVTETVTAPTTPATPTPPPTRPPSSGTTTPPTVPVAPEVEMLGPDGIGDIVLGMPVADAYGTDTLGMYDPVTETLMPWDGSGAENVCMPAGQAKRTTPDAARVWMDDSAGVSEIAIWPTISNPDVQTVEGLRLFDDLDRVLELYPDARVDDTNPSTLRIYVDDWGGQGSVLTIRDLLTGTVMDMSVVLVGGEGGCYE